MYYSALSHLEGETLCTYLEADSLVFENRNISKMHLLHKSEETEVRIISENDTECEHPYINQDMSKHLQSFLIMQRINVRRYEVTKS